MYYLYILECADKTFYTGIAIDVDRRLDEHNNSNLGAKYTRPRRPVKLVYRQGFKNRSLACKREVEVKRMTRSQKINLIKQK